MPPRGQRDPHTRAPLAGAANDEFRLIALSVSEAEKRIASGKASDSLLIYYLKLGSARSELEVARIQNENALLNAKAASLRQQASSGTDYQDLMDVIFGYRGRVFDEDLP